MQTATQALEALLREEGDAVLDLWSRELRDTGARLGTGAQTERQQLLAGLLAALQGGAPTDDIQAPAWDELRNRLDQLSRSWAAQGLPAAETTSFLLAFKRPLFEGLQRRLASGAGQTEAVWAVSSLIDRLAQWMLAVYQRSREDIIQRQQQELLELSTPVVKLWDGVLAVPMIGTLDSARTQLVMETLLQRIVETGSALAIIDITGVPTVDTLVAQHLIKTVTAIRLMGADCIISGIRPQIAQTMVHLGIDLQGITTKATLADALAQALRRNGYGVTRSADAA